MRSRLFLGFGVLALALFAFANVQLSAGGDPDPGCDKTCGCSVSNKAFGQRSCSGTLGLCKVTDCYYHITGCANGESEKDNHLDRCGENWAQCASFVNEGGCQITD
jgi:hypothetical protein